MGDSKTKSSRLDAIRSILSKSQVGSQEELIGLLRKEGFESTQATLSRDMKALHVVKVPTANGYRYQLHGNTPVASTETVSGGIVNITSSGNLVVIRTSPGYAGVVASTIDTCVVDESIMGTIAGDDTVLLILKTPDSLEPALDLIAGYIPGIKDKLVK